MPMISEEGNRRKRWKIPVYGLWFVFLLLALVAVANLGTAQPKVQVVKLDQSVFPGFFSPKLITVKKGIPVRILVTSRHREHVNRISILPWVRASGVLIPGKATVIEFTPDRTGVFKIRNIGHGFEATLKVVE